MADQESARDLAQLMVEIGQGLGRKVKAALSSMDQPLGSAIGNALEFAQACRVINGTETDSALARVSFELAAQLLVLAELESSPEAALKKVQKLVSSGQAAEKLRELISAQGGRPEVVSHPEKLPQATIVKEVKAVEDGYLKSLAARDLGIAGLKLGAGRLRKSDPIDPAVGLVLQRRVGDRVEKGDVLALIHAKDESSAAEASKAVLTAVTLSGDPVQPPPDIAEWVG